MDMQVAVESVLRQGAVAAAEQLIGWHFYKAEQDGTLTGGVITETEAYTQSDAASHSYNGKTQRNSVMFGPAGVLYVYFTYGMHWCANIVTGAEGEGEAVLIRSLQPTHGIPAMRRRRGNRPDNQLCNGPAKLCQALVITGADSAQVINGSTFLLQPADREYRVLRKPRIGISRNTEKLWRFVVA